MPMTGAIRVAAQPWEDCGLFGAAVVYPPRPRNRCCPLCDGKGSLQIRFYRDEHEIACRLLHRARLRGDDEDYLIKRTEQRACWRCDGMGRIPWEPDRD